MDETQFNPKTLEVIQTHVLRGTGAEAGPNTAEDPLRRVPHYYMTDGRFLGTAPDPYKDAQTQFKIDTLGKLVSEQQNIINELRAEIDQIYVDTQADAEEREAIAEELEASPPPEEVDDDGSPE